MLIYIARLPYKTSNMLTTKRYSCANKKVFFSSATGNAPYMHKAHDILNWKTTHGLFYGFSSF